MHNSRKIKKNVIYAFKNLHCDVSNPLPHTNVIFFVCSKSTLLWKIPYKDHFDPQKKYIYKWLFAISIVSCFIIIDLPPQLLKQKTACSVLMLLFCLCRVHQKQIYLYFSFFSANIETINETIEDYNIIIPLHTNHTKASHLFIFRMKF